MAWGFARAIWARLGLLERTGQYAGLPVGLFPAALSALVWWLEASAPTAAGRLSAPPMPVRAAALAGGCCLSVGFVSMAFPMAGDRIAERVLAASTR